MASSYLKTYANTVNKQLDFLPTWPLDYYVKLGDVGVLEGNIFKRTDTLERLGITGLQVRKGKGQVDLECTSENGVEVEVGGEAKEVVTADVKFNQEGAVFLRISDYESQQIESTDLLGKEILARYKRGEWDRNRVVVTEVVHASSATILVSGNGKASASFTLDSGLTAITALAKGKMSLKHNAGNFAAKIIGEEVSPLLRTCGLKRKLFGNDFRTTKSSLSTQSTTEAEDELLFGRVDDGYQTEE